MVRVRIPGFLVEICLVQPGVSQMGLMVELPLGRRSVNNLKDKHFEGVLSWDWPWGGRMLQIRGRILMIS